MAVISGSQPEDMGSNPVAGAVAVVQLAERRIVVPKVVDSRSIGHIGWLAVM